MKHQLQLLSPGAFQSMAAALAVAEFGAGIQVMGAGKDGGRDLYFEGPLTFGSTEESAGEAFTGYTVFQVKHHAKVSDSPTADASWLWGEVKKELDAWADWDKKDPRAPLPDQLIFITNVALTPVQNSGGHDAIRKNIEAYRAKLNNASRDVDDPDAVVDKAQRRKRIAHIRAIRFWDGNQIDALLNANAAVRRRFDAFLTASDVFTFISELTGNVSVKDSEPVLLDQARTELLSDGLVYFDDAGDRDNRGIPVHEVAIDLPATFPGGGGRSTVLRHVLERGDNILARDITAVDGPRHIVLTGQPGNGKTTISKLIVQAYRVAALKGSTALAANHDAVLAGTEAVLHKLGHQLPRHRRWPLRIDLAHYAEERGHKLDESLMRYVAERISKRSNHGTVTPAALTSWLGAWPWLVVFDGLDEVTEPETRRTVIERVVEFVNNAEGDRCDLLAVITTRPVGYTENIDPSSFETVALDDLTPEEAVTFGTKAAQVRLRGDEERIGKVTAALRGAANDENLVKLLRTPLQVLILSIIVDGAGTIAPDRYSLFSDYYDTVVRRERNKPTMVRTLLTKYEPFIHQLHERAGFLLQQRSETAEHSTAVLTEPELRDIVWHILDEAEFQPDGHHSDVLDSIIKSATQRLVLIAPRNDGFGFDVRSLQELVAARRISDAPLETRIRRLRLLAPSPHWRNTWLFAAGKVFAEPRAHEHQAVVELVETIDQGAAERIGVHLPIGPELALDILDDGMARAWPIWSRRILAHGLHVLDAPSAFGLDRSLRILLRYADSGVDQRNAVARLIRDDLTATACRLTLASASDMVPAIERDLRVHERTLGLGLVLDQIAKSPHPASPRVDWGALNDEIDTSPYPATLDPVIRGAADALEAIKNEVFTAAHQADLVTCLNVPEAAEVLSAALAHVLPGDVALFLQLRSVLSQRFRAPLGERILA
ncbi:hypothetical protein GCM10022237_46120 [Nocardioides ginsengisoli]|uniref:NACHT domain-containing NTPase n=1 Tax=Nocardioides ginsengisoli TaxID=363868 RepID=A0ABW3W6L8_9ACTN